MSQRMAVDDWRAMIDKTEAQSDAEPVICPNCGVSVWQNEAALVQFDAEPVRVTDEMVKAASDVLFERTSIAFGGTYMREALEAALNPQQVALYTTAPPCPDASAGLIEAADATAIECAIGGKYEMPDGRSFWIDAPVAREMTCRVIDAIRARATDRSGK